MCCSVRMPIKNSSNKKQINYCNMQAIEKIQSLTNGKTLRNNHFFLIEPSNIANRLTHELRLQVKLLWFAIMGLFTWNWFLKVSSQLNKFCAKKPLQLIKNRKRSKSLSINTASLDYNYNLYCLNLMHRKAFLSKLILKRSVTRIITGFYQCIFLSKASIDIVVVIFLQYKRFAIPKLVKVVSKLKESKATLHFMSQIIPNYFKFSLWKYFQQILIFFTILVTIQSIELQDFVLQNGNPSEKIRFNEFIKNNEKILETNLVKFLDNITWTDYHYSRNPLSTLSSFQSLSKRYLDKNIEDTYLQSLKYVLMLSGFGKLRECVMNHCNINIYILPYCFVIANRQMDVVLRRQKFRFTNITYHSELFKANIVNGLLFELEMWRRRYSWCSRAISTVSVFTVELYNELSTQFDPVPAVWNSNDNFAEIYGEIIEEISRYESLMSPPDDIGNAAVYSNSGNANLDGSGEAPGRRQSFSIVENVPNVGNERRNSLQAIYESLASQSRVLASAMNERRAEDQSIWKVTEAECANYDLGTRLWENENFWNCHKYNEIDNQIGLVIGYFQEQVNLSVKTYFEMYHNMSLSYLGFIDNLPEMQGFNDECAICLDTQQGAKKKLPCGHVLHSDCLKKFFAVSLSCPMCRREYRMKVKTDYGRLISQRAQIIELIDKELFYVFYGFVHLLQKPPTKCQVWEICMSMNATLRGLKRNFLTKVYRIKEQRRSNGDNNEQLSNIFRAAITIADEAYDYHYFGMEVVFDIISKTNTFEYGHLFTQTTSKVIVNSRMIEIDYNKFRRYIPAH